MLNSDIEKKCSLLTRFVTDDLDDYCRQVRDNLSVYLNTAEKIRLRISRNSVTLTDRTIWHNKIERVPVSLVRQCKVDHLSPKICYFVNETITNKYQVVALLCKTAEDSHKLITILQHKINSQGHYRAHNEWLQNGSFSYEETTTPKSKRKTLASVEIIESPKLVTRFAWGIPRQTTSLPQTPNTPSSVRSRREELDSTLDCESDIDEDNHDYVPISEIMVTSNPTRPQIRQPLQQDQVSISSKYRSRTKQLEPLPSPPNIVDNEYQNHPLRFKLEQSQCSHIASPVLSQHRKQAAGYSNNLGSMYTDQNKTVLSPDSSEDYYSDFSLPATPVLTRAVSRQQDHARNSDRNLRVSDHFRLHTNRQASHGGERRIMRVKSVQEKQDHVIMRKPKFLSSSTSYAESRRDGVSMCEMMRSSVVQYDSDTDAVDVIESETAAVQHNSNGIARVVVGGNEDHSKTVSHQNNSSVIAEETESRLPKTPTNEDNEEHDVPRQRQNGDGEPSPVSTIHKQSNGNNAKVESPCSDNALDGIYDNLDVLSPIDIKPVSTSQKRLPLSIDELLKSCEMLDKSMDRMQNAAKEVELEHNGREKGTIDKNPTADAAAVDKIEYEEEEEEEYELVLTGLKQLTKGGGKPEAQPETRYPHQVIAAISSIEMNRSRPATIIEQTTPSRPELQSAPSNSVTTPSGSATPSSKATPVKMRSRSKQEKPKAETPQSRPQSVSSGLHLIKNNDLRRSVRRKGQYKSIAEYEKLTSPNPTNENGIMSVESNIKIATPQPCRPRNSIHSVVQTAPGNQPPAAPPTSPHSPRKTRKPTKPPHISPLMQRSTTSLSNSQQATGFNHVQMRSKERAHKSSRQSIVKESSRQSIVKDLDGGSRRASVISISSVPNHVVLRRVNSNNDEAKQRRAETNRKSRSFDRKNNFRLSDCKLDEGVALQGLTLVGSRNSLISHGKSQNNLSCHSSQRAKYSSEAAGLHHLSLGEPNTTPILDGNQRRSSSVQPIRQSLITNHQQWSPMPGFKKPATKAQYVSLPNQPDLAFFRNQHLSTPQFNWNGLSWDQNPGFKRFFDSILTYGPNGTKAKEGIKHSKTSATKVGHNQPDIVLESLNPDLSRADDSDSESSIRSSASAYWPPELKQQCYNNCDDFEETGSWQFHNGIIGQAKHPINAS